MCFEIACRLNPPKGYEMLFEFGNLFPVNRHQGHQCFGHENFIFVPDVEYFRFRNDDPTSLSNHLGAANQGISTGGFQKINLSLYFSKDFRSRPDGLIDIFVVVGR